MGSTSKKVCVMLTLVTVKVKESVRKFKKNGVEKTAWLLSTSDNPAVEVTFLRYCSFGVSFVRRRSISGPDYLQNSVCPEEVYYPSEIIGKERKPGFSGYLQLSFRQQVSGTVPSLNSPVWMFHYGISLSQMLQIGVEP